MKYAVSTFVGFLFVALSAYFDVGVHILTTDEGIEENVSQHGDNEPIAEDWTS